MEDQSIERYSHMLAWIIVVGFLVFFGVSVLRSLNYF